MQGVVARPQHGSPGDLQAGLRGAIARHERQDLAFDSDQHDGARDDESRFHLRPDAAQQDVAAQHDRAEAEDEEQRRRAARIDRAGLGEEPQRDRRAEGDHPGHQRPLDVALGRHVGRHGVIAAQDVGADEEDRHDEAGGHRVQDRGVKLVDEACGERTCEDCGGVHHPSADRDARPPEGGVGPDRLGRRGVPRAPVRRVGPSSLQAAASTGCGIACRDHASEPLLSEAGTTTRRAISIPHLDAKGQSMCRPPLYQPGTGAARWPQEPREAG